MILFYCPIVGGCAGLGIRLSVGVSMLAVWRGSHQSDALSLCPWLSHEPETIDSLAEVLTPTFALEKNNIKTVEQSVIVPVVVTMSLCGPQSNNENVCFDAAWENACIHY